MNTCSFMRKVLLAATCAAVTAITASATPINVTLVNGGSPAVVAPSVTIAGTTENNIYIGPYTVSINGVNTLAMCMNFNITSYIGDNYTAYETAVGSANLNNTYSPTKGQEYQEEAYLFSQIVNPADTAAQRTAIQVAAWNIMAYGITGSNYTTVNNLSDSLYIDAALANASGMSNIGYVILSDTVKGGEQEFMIDPSGVTPEPSSLVLMLAPALLSGAEVLRRRRLGAISC